MYLEQSGTTAQSIANYLAAHPEHKLDLLLEIKQMNVTGNANHTTATASLATAKASVDESLQLFRYVHDGLGLLGNPLTFVASDGFQLIENFNTTSILQVFPIAVPVYSDPNN